MTPVLLMSRGPSLVPSRAASRTASPVLSHASGDDPSLPLVLCSLLQREFSAPRSPGRSGSFRRKSRRHGEDQDDENGGQSQPITPKTKTILTNLVLNLSTAFTIVSIIFLPLECTFCRLLDVSGFVIAYLSLLNKYNTIIGCQIQLYSDKDNTAYPTTQLNHSSCSGLSKGNKENKYSYLFLTLTPLSASKRYT